MTMWNAPELHTPGDAAEEPERLKHEEEARQDRLMERDEDRRDGSDDWEGVRW